MSEPISDDVRRFIVDSIDSVAQLEALLLLRNHRHRTWSCQAVAEEIYNSEQHTAELLDKLVARGFIAVEDVQPRAFRYQPASLQVAESIDRLADTYSRYLVPVTNLIHGKSRRIIQQFADAFKLKKEE